MNKLLLAALLCCMQATCHRYAVILRPMINVSGTALAHHSYDALPHAGGADNPYAACPRLHQLLYNEQFKVIKEEGNGTCIEIPQFYCSTEGTKKNIYGWVNKNDIIYIDNLPKQAQCALVPPLSYAFPQHIDARVITLCEPWYCKACKTTFSAGTRFISARPCKGRTVLAYAIHPESKQRITIKIPAKNCIHQSTDKEQIRHTYVNLLRSWAHKPGIVPYVWGGCSLIKPLKEGSFKETTINAAGGTGIAFIYPQAEQFPVDGFDCSGLILRAAQAAGLPYFCKNSATLAADLKEVQTAQHLKDGDLIWIPAHVMAVGSINNNTIIEARHYGHGYGKVHEIPLNNLFKDIDTFADLFAAIQQKRPLQRLNSKGEAVQLIKQIKLLAIESCWDKVI